MRAGVGTDARQSGAPQRQEMDFVDGRVMLASGNVATLDTQGFGFISHQTALGPEDFYNTDVVFDRYFPEVENIIRQNIPGVARVLIFDHAIRSGGEKEKSVKQVNPYAGIVHCDATVRSGHTRAKDQILGTNETEVKYGRLPACWGPVRPSEEWQQLLFRSEVQDHDSPLGRGGDHMIVNVWRPIQATPVKQWPLALLDASSISQEDVHPSILQTYDNTPGGQAGNIGKMQDESKLKVKDLQGNTVRYRIGEVLTPLMDTSHKWVIFPRMTIQEALLLKVFDSRRDGRARFASHSAAFDPRGDPDAHRESIEVRCLVILEPTAAQQGRNESVDGVSSKL